MSGKISRPGIIYLATNKTNGKSYVGQTRSRFKVRICNHISVAVMGRDQVPFHRALRKYGSEGFNFAVLETVEVGGLDEREKHWIDKLGCKAPRGYNRSSGGQGALGVEYTDERRERIRQSQLGDRNRMKNPETARKHALAITGPLNVAYGKPGNRLGKTHKASAETVAKQRANDKRPEVIAVRRERMLRRQAELNTTEMREKRAVALREYWSSEAGMKRRAGL